MIIRIISLALNDDYAPFHKFFENKVFVVDDPIDEDDRTVFVTKFMDEDSLGELRKVFPHANTRYEDRSIWDVYIIRKGLVYEEIIL